MAPIKDDVCGGGVNQGPKEEGSMVHASQPVIVTDVVLIVIDTIIIAFAFQ